MELSTEANTSASHGSVVMIPNKFHFPQDVFTFKALVQTHIWIKKQKSKGTYTANSNTL